MMNKKYMMAILAIALTNSAIADENDRSVEYSGVGIQIGQPSQDSPRMEIGGVITTSQFGRRDTYGMSHARLQIGNAIGINGTGNVGYNVLPASSHVILGFEPFNVDFNLARRVDRDNNAGRMFFNWNPSVALGVQADAGMCRIAAIGKIGAGFSTLRGDRGDRWGGSYGFSGYINCAEAANIGVELERLMDNDSPVDIVRADAQFMLSGRHGLGFRFEQLTVHDGAAHFLIERPEANDHSEMRAFVTYSLIPRR